MERILFLDFDGVLHPTGPRSTKFSQLDVLVGFLRETEFLDLRIVVSSTWRQLYGVERLRRFFPLDIAARIVGVTPVLDEYDSDNERGEEIRAWLEQEAPAAIWAALDDDPEGFSPRLKSRVVLTDGAVGVNQEAIAQLRALLVPQ